MIAKRPKPIKPAATPATSGAVVRSDPEVVAFLHAWEHPRKEEYSLVRSLILDADTHIGEGIKWNVPSFRTKKDWFATFHVRASKGVQIILHLGAKSRPQLGAFVIRDPKGLMRWLAKDRALVTLGLNCDVSDDLAAFKAIVRSWIKQV